MKRRNIKAGQLDVAYLDWGPESGDPVFLMHGFPYDALACAEAAEILATKGLRVITPWLRGYGETRFLSPDTPRSGEQAVLGMDLLALMDALEIRAAALAGYDWGGRAACIVAALWPERARCLVSTNSYNIQNIATSGAPAHPETEYTYWYQYYLHGERGAAGLAQYRADYAKLLWRLWSPNWAFSEETFAASAAAFDNPDFVEVVVHSYRHRYGLVPGDPAAEAVEARLAAQPPITVPTITIDGEDDSVHPACDAAAHARHFTGLREHRRWPGIGHNTPQEAPEAFAQAVLDASAMAS